MAVVEKASRADERVVLGQLADLEGLIRRNGMTGPALILIGEVVQLADDA